jgi:hypothetical protein
MLLFLSSFFGYIFSDLGSILAPFWIHFRHFGTLWGIKKTDALSQARRGAPQEHFGSILAPFWTILAPFWLHVGSILSSFSSQKPAFWNSKIEFQKAVFLHCFALLCLALPCFGLLCPTFPWFALLCLALPCFILLCLALPYLTLLCLALPRTCRA